MLLLPVKDSLNIVEAIDSRWMLYLPVPNSLCIYKTSTACRVTPQASRQAE